MRNIEFSEKCAAIGRAAGNRQGHVYTPSALQTAMKALTDVWVALDQHGIVDPFMAVAGEDQFASHILTACRRACATESSNLTAAEIEPIALLGVAVSAAADQLSRPLTPTKGPAIADSHTEVAYVALPRQPETPPWGPDGEAPLVISLGRPDLDPTYAGFISAGHPANGHNPGPWEWHLDHKVPGKFFIGGRIQVITLPPSPEVAAEIGVSAAHVLRGDIRLPC